METTWLNEFLVLAESENYLAAADMLFISQSSLSKHIKALEAELGVALFTRTTRKVILTDQGRKFADCARQILDIQYGFIRDLEADAANGHQTLTIGSIPMMAPYRITDIIVKFQQENPGCSINLLEDESASLKELLRKNQCDLAFIREEEEKETEFARFPFTSDHLVAVLPVTHPLAHEKAILLPQLAHENFLFLKPGSLLYDLSVSSCKKAGFTPNITYTGKRAENIIDLVEKGAGVSLLMEKPILALKTPRVSIVDIEPMVTTRISIYYKKNIPLSASAKKFMLNAL